MILPLFLVFAFSGSQSPTTTIDAAHAELHDGRLEVLVKTSAPVGRHSIRTKLRARHMVVYVDGAQVRPDRTRLGTADQPIEALPRPTYAKLEIPFAAGLICAGPIAVSADENGVHAGVACSATGAEPATAARPARTTAAAAPGPEASDQVPAAAKTSPPPVPAVEAKAKIETADVAATPVASPPAPAPVGASPAPPAPPSPATAGRGPTMIFAPILLVLAAVAGFVFWRRRRVLLGGHIHILETAQLGPKRSLILAEVNGTTLIIGASEAGISLLSSSPTPGAPPPDSAPPGPSRPETSVAKIPTTFTDLTTGDGASASLGNATTRPLWNKARPAISEDVLTGNQDEDDAFAAMLLESIEDQELRARLANGIGGKVR